MDYAGKSGADLMDFSLLDDGFSSPRAGAARANYVTLGSAAAAATAAKVPSIYPSLRHLDGDEFMHYDKDDENEMITSRELSSFQDPTAVKNGLFMAAAATTTAQGPIELDSVKHKLSSFWNNVKYGWTTYLKKPAKINLDKNEPVYLLGKRFDSSDSPVASSAQMDDPNSSYDNCDGGGFDSLKETPIYSINAVNYDHRSRVSPKGGSLLAARMGRHNSTRIDATYFFVDEDPPPPPPPPPRSSATTVAGDESAKTLLEQEIHSRLWFTYRKDFEPLAGNPKYTSDCGWGCMLRSAQMLVGQALLLHFFGANWSLYASLKTDSDLSMYKQILVWFNDRPSPECPFGLHRLLDIADRKPALTGGGGAGEPAGSSRVGTWFGPTSVCLLMKDALGESFAANPLLRQVRIYCAQDCTIYKQDVLNMCGCAARGDEASFVPVILLVSVRLGGEELNQIYTPSLKRFLAMDTCIGLIGGKPKHSLYFIGYQGDKVIYLDPHLAQPTVVVSNSNSSSSGHSSLGHSFDDASILAPAAFDNTSFHCTSPSKTSFAKLDPSLAIGFYCRTLRSLNDLCDLIHDMSKTEMYPIFGINDDTFEKAQQSFKVYFKDAAAPRASPSKKPDPPAPAQSSSRVHKLSSYLQPYLTAGPTTSSSSRQDRSPSRGFMNLNSLHNRFLSSSSSSSSSAATGHSAASKRPHAKKKDDYDDFEFI